MTPVQQKELQKIISAWIKARQKSLGVTSGQLAELVGRRASTIHSYLSRKLPVPFNVILPSLTRTTARLRKRSNYSLPMRISGAKGKINE